MISELVRYDMPTVGLRTYFKRECADIKEYSDRNDPQRINRMIYETGRKIIIECYFRVGPLTKTPHLAIEELKNTELNYLKNIISNENNTYSVHSAFQEILRWERICKKMDNLRIYRFVSIAVANLPFTSKMNDCTIYTWI